MNLQYEVIAEILLLILQSFYRVKNYIFCNGIKTFQHPHINVKRSRNLPPDDCSHYNWYATGSNTEPETAQEMYGFL